MDPRNRTIIRYGIAGLVMNLLLSVAKLVCGEVIHSRAIMMDALNGLTDMVSSIFSISSAAYAGKGADREHPFGFGRLEYVASMFTTVFIVFMGLRGIWGAIADIVVPDEPPQYGRAVILLMFMSLLAKIVCGTLTRRAGKRIGAIGLIMTGTETIGDAVISAAILIAIAVYRLTGADIENWVSILISLFIVKTGVEMLRECVSKLLGQRAGPELQKRVRQLIASQNGVLNVFNLVIHNYGEGVWVGSVDVEVDADMSAGEATKLSRRIIRKASEEGIRLTSVGICGTNLDEGQNAALWDRILAHIGRHPEFVRAYAFSYDAEDHLACFYVVPDVTVRKTKAAAVAKLQQELEREFPGIVFSIDTGVEI